MNQMGTSFPKTGQRTQEIPAMADGFLKPLLIVIQAYFVKLEGSLLVRRFDTLIQPGYFNVGNALL